MTGYDFGDVYLMGGKTIRYLSYKDPNLAFYNAFKGDRHRL